MWRCLRSSSLYVFALVALQSSLSAQSILPFAGGYNDDNRPALATPIFDVNGIAVDSKGNVYYSDYLSYRVRKIDAVTGRIVTVAGTGRSGTTGDSGPATLAQLGAPAGLTLDNAGGLVITDLGSSSIRRLDLQSGTITRLAGLGRTTGVNKDSGPLATFSLSVPTNTALDAQGNLLISDGYSQRIRSVDLKQGSVTTIAGNGTSGFSGDGGPATQAAISIASGRTVVGIVADGDGNVFFSDYVNHRIRRVDAKSGVITTIIGGDTATPAGDGGPASQATTGRVGGIHLDHAGNLLFLDLTCGCIRKIDKSTNIVSRLVKFALIDFAITNNDSIVAVENRNEAFQIDLTDPANLTSTSIGGSVSPASFGDAVPATQGFLAEPSDIVGDGKGNVYIADSYGVPFGRIAVVDKNNVMSTLVAEPAVGLALDGSGALYYSTGARDSVKRFDLATKKTTLVAGGSRGFSGDGGPATDAKFYFPQGLAVDDEGNLYIRDTYNYRIRKVNTNGVITTFAGTGAAENTGDGGPATAAGLNLVGAFNGNIAFGADGSLNVPVLSGDVTMVMIRRIDRNGTISSLKMKLPPEAVMNPACMALDGQTRGVVAGQGIVAEFDPASGTIGTYIGTGHQGAGSSGDFGFVRSAGVGTVPGMRFLGHDLYIADIGDHAVRVVPACVTVGKPQLTAPADASTSVATSPRFAWSRVAGAFHYDVYLDTVNPPQKIVGTDVTATAFNPSNLTPLTKYYWQVVAKGDPFCTPLASTASDGASFTTQGNCVPPAPVVPIASSQ